MLEDQVNGLIDVIEHPRVANWFNELATKKPDLFFEIVKDNSFYFKRHWGKPKTKFKNTNALKEGFDKSWTLNYKGLNLVIYTGSTGSCFLCHTITTEDDFKKDNVIGITLISFLEEVLMKLTTTYS